jgi:hypothetical protein
MEVRMPLKRASSGDGRALAIRDHLLPLVREKGTLRIQSDSVRLVVFRTEPWLLAHWTPFNEVATGEAASPGYRHAIERQHTRPDLPYGLNIWCAGTKVLSIIWADNGAFEVIKLSHGAWQDQALAL